MVKIALMSVADIKNYGDVLFSFVARQEILKQIPNAKFRFFTPTEIELEGEKFFEYSRTNMNAFSPDVIMTIGGEVIHKYDDVVWQDMYHGKIEKPSNAMFDWLEYPAKYKSWFSVGALTLDVDAPSVTDDEIGRLNYIGARGVLSKKILEHKSMMFNNQNINIVPDIGWIFPRYFKKYKRTLRKISKKYNFSFRSNRYFVFNVNWTSIPAEKINSVLDELNAFQKKTGLKLVVVSVISSYKALSVDIAEYFGKNKNIICMSDLSLNETGAILCGAKFFVGSSLHCAITTMACGKPAAVIHGTQLTKLQDLFGHAMMTDMLSHCWDDLPYLLNKLKSFSNRRKRVLKKYVAFMQACFDEKFKTILSNIIKVCNVRKDKLSSKIWRIVYKRPARHIEKKLKQAYHYILRKIPVKTNLLVIDNFEPSFLKTGFRVKEFNWLLKSSKETKLLTFSDIVLKVTDWKKRAESGDITWTMPQPRSLYNKNKKNYMKHFSLTKDKFLYLQDRKYHSNGAYIMFIYNTYLFLPFLEKNKIPFVFTLFPGGGLRLNHKFSDHMLKTVFASPMFRGVFVPQKIIYDYLIEKKLCPTNKIYFSYGGGFFQFIQQDIQNKIWYKNGKDTFDICFVAYRYMVRGLDKGFDLFLYSAREIIKKYPFVHFHCVGTNTLDDFEEDFSDIQSNLHFYGSRQSEFFPDFYSKMDLTLSPNRPNMLDKGAFDGFPLSVEGMFFGVPLFCTDELNLNYNYIDKKELVIIKPDVADIVSKIEFYLNDLDKLHEIGKQGQKKIQKYFDIEYQQQDRKKFIEEYLNIKI